MDFPALIFQKQKHSFRDLETRCFNYDPRIKCARNGFPLGYWAKETAKRLLFQELTICKRGIATWWIVGRSNERKINQDSWARDCERMGNRLRSAPSSSEISRGEAREEIVTWRHACLSARNERPAHALAFTSRTRDDEQPRRSPRA